MNPMRIRLLVFLCAAVLAGCSAAGRPGFAEQAPAAAKALEAAPGLADVASQPLAAGSAGGDENARAAAAGDLASLPQERMVIKTATLAVNVRDVSAAFSRAVQLAEAGGGYVQTSTESQEGGESADLTIRIPPQGFLPLIASLGALGTVTTKTITGEDVTQEYYDLNAELDNQTQVRGRLLQLLKQAAKVPDAIAVEQELERVGANINRITGRMKYLQTMSGMCTVNVSLYGEERAVSEGFINWSLVGHGFWRAAQILVSVLFVILQVLVVAIPLAVAGGAIAWGVVVLGRRTRRWRAARAGSATRAPSRRR